MPNIERDKQIADICDNVKWGREYSTADAYLIESVVMNGHKDSGILGIAIYAFARIYSIHKPNQTVSAYKREKKSKYLLQHLGHERPFYPRDAAITALKQLDAVQYHMEFLLQECEREKAYYRRVTTEDADKFGYDIDEEIDYLIRKSDFINFVKRHAQNVE